MLFPTSRMIAFTPKWTRNILWRIARAVPSLDLPFADTKSLTDAVTGQSLVTFTRASSGTYVGSDGVLQTATTNLLLRSEEFNDAYWTKTNSTVTANATTAPNGTLTAEKLITNSGASSGRVNVSITATADTPATLSCYAKQGETNIFGLFISDGITGRAADFNLTTGTVSGTPTAGMTASIQPVGDGWYRCVVTVAGASLSGTTRSLRIVQTVVANDGTSGLFIWGAQFEQSTTAGEYIPTTSTINSAPRFDHNPTTGESLGLLVEEQRTNLVRNNTMVGAVAGSPGTPPTNGWVIVNTATYASSIIGTGIENGVNYIDVQYVIAAGAAASGGLVYADTPTGTASTTYTGSYYLKLVSGTSPQIRFIWQDGVNTTGKAFFDLTSTLTRYADTLTTAVGATLARFAISVAASPSGATFVIRIGLPQVEQGAFATSVIPTTTATVTRSADVASITGSNFGTTRTNLLLRSEEFDNASWVNGNTTELANVLSAPNGTLTADKIIENAGAGFKSIEQATTVSALTYTFSVYAKAAERSIVQLLWSGGASTNFANFNLSTGTITGGTYTSATITPAGSDWFRLSITSALAAGSYSGIISLQTNASATRAGSYTGDGTSGIYVWGAQFEQSTTVTPYIPTTSATVTVVDSSWYRQDEGTVFAESSAPTNNTTVLSLSDGTASNRVLLDKGTNSSRLIVTASNVSQASIQSSYTYGTFVKSAFALRLDDVALSNNGVLAGLDVTATIPVFNQIYIGSNNLGNVPNNGPIKRITYWPARLPNSTIQALTQ